jgi:hypothetical protein
MDVSGSILSIVAMKMNFSLPALLQKANPADVLIIQEKRKNPI